MEEKIETSTMEKTKHMKRNKEAEESFKSISEAYGVLIDKEKRGKYDIFSGTDRVRYQQDFGFSQEEIFQDVFSNPNTSDIFRDLI